MSSPLPSKKAPHSGTKGVAGSGVPPYDGNMEPRVENLEVALAALKLDIEIIKATGATKTDLAELRGELKALIADAKTAVIMWVTGAIFLAQLLPALIKMFIK